MMDYRGFILNQGRMDRKTMTLVTVSAVVIIGVGTAGYVYTRQNQSAPPASKIELPVPYLSQVPDGIWVNPWANACEEASVLMVQAYYDETKIDKSEAKQAMQAMFAWENENFGKNFDTTAEETGLLVAAKANFITEIKTYPTLDEIKDQLRKNRPVIAMLDQFTLNQKPRDLNASFHVVVIVGFDDTTQEFIINDPADSERRYPYERLMNALHDYEEVADEAVGKPVVLFTKSKLF